MSFAEAARVCLDRHHASPSSFLVTDNESHEPAIAEWDQSDDRLAGAWANKDEATEFAAYALSLAAIEATRGLVAVRRAETRTGVDYYLDQPGGRPDDLERAFRLEVSGTDDGNEAAIQRRLLEKQNQARKGISNLPAIASVAGFSALRIISVDVVGT